MALVHRRIDGLLHGTQQHGMDLQCIRPVFGGQGNLLKLTRLRVVCNGHAKTQRLQVIAQHVLFLGRRAFVHTEQTNVFAAGNKVSRAHIGRQHGFFNQAVCHVACTRHNFLNAPCLIADDLGFSRLKINCAPNTTLFKQRLVNVVQVE